MYVWGSLRLTLHLGFDRHVEGDRMEKAYAPINSCKNGILIFSHVHSAFDKYLLAINTDVSDLYPSQAIDL
jgi:hypothetical protein